MAGVAGAMPNTLVFSRVLATWFDRTRGLWIGFTGGVGIGGGCIVFPIVAATLLERYGWRTGFLAVGVIVGVVGFPILYLFLRDAPVPHETASVEAVPPDGLTWAEAMRTPRFWMIFSVIPIGGGCMTAIFSTVVPLLTDRGVPMVTAINVIQFFSFTTLIVQTLSGWLVDRSSTPKVVAPLFLIAASGLWMLLHVHTTVLLLLSGSLIGVGAGVEYSIMLFLLSRYFGLKSFGSIAGTAFGGTLLFGAVAPICLNTAFDLTGRYDVAIYAIIGILIYSSLAVLTFGPYKFTAKEPA
jgi:MFS family permease